MCQSFHGQVMQGKPHGVPSWMRQCGGLLSQRPREALLTSLKITIFVCVQVKIYCFAKKKNTLIFTFWFEMSIKAYMKIKI